MAVGSALSRNQSSGNTTYVQQTVVQQPAAMLYDCPFCCSRVTGKPSDDGLHPLTCPNCGGILQESNAVPVQPQPVQSTPASYSSTAPTSSYSSNPSAGYKAKSCLGTLFGVLVICGIITAMLWIVLGGCNRNDNYGGYHQEPNGYHEQAEQHDAIYVSALGRDVPWDSEYDSYYDRETDCYFFLNSEMDPPVWQYWYEGVSSDYGDYGWMEWDAKEKSWYIQTGKDKWSPLPEDKIRSYFWHFD